MGSTTVLLAVMDNRTRIHGKLHPMIAILSVGDCEILLLRRTEGQLRPVFHTEMQRIDGNAQAPLQLTRFDASIDERFDEDLAVEVIDKGSAVHCVSAYEGDIIVLGSDGVFDNLFAEEIVLICEEVLDAPMYPGAKFVPSDRQVLLEAAKRIVKESHAKSQRDVHGFARDAPIGRGGKVDDTSCIVGEVVEWKAAYTNAWSRLRRQNAWQHLATCGGLFSECHHKNDSSDEEGSGKNIHQKYPSKPSGSFSTYYGSFSEYGGSFANLNFTPQKKTRGIASFSSMRGSSYGASFNSSLNHSFNSDASGKTDPRSLRHARRRDDDSDDEQSKPCSIS